MKVDLITLMPEDMPPYATPAWLGALSASINEPAVIAAFQAETGITAAPANSPLDRLIDEATGRDAEIVAAFVRWFNANVWGPWDAQSEEVR